MSGGGGGGGGGDVTNHGRGEHTTTSCKCTNHAPKHKHNSSRTPSSNICTQVGPSRASSISKFISLSSKCQQRTHPVKHEMSEILKQSEVEEKEDTPLFRLHQQKIDSLSKKCLLQKKECKMNIENILKQSFTSRGKLTKNISDNVKIVGNHDDKNEWKIVENTSLLCPFNNTISTNRMPSSTITPSKIIEPVSKSCHGKMDLTWENPVIGCNKHAGIPSIAMTTKTKTKLHTCDKLHSFCSFSIDMLGKARVIGPVDNKFIACVIFTNDDEEMLVLIDQHAAHERIRLERMINQVGYYTNMKNTSAQCSQLIPPANLSLYEKDLNLLIHYKKEFNTIGLNFSFIRSTTNSSHRVFILSVPTMVVNGNDVKLEAKGSSMNSEFLKEFIQEQVEYMQSTGKPCQMSSRMVFKALASYACHGAIKFGDKISICCCRGIVKDLAKCKLPFQCAHGRPTIAPIFKLSFLDGVLKKSLGKPNMLKLKSKMCSKDGQIV